MIGDYAKTVNIRVPIAFIISDTQGADRLCGRYQIYSSVVSRLHRTCLCTPADACNMEIQCEWVLEEDMKHSTLEGTKAQLTKLSLHKIPNHAFFGLDFGSNPHGIFGATPNDILHGLKLGIAKYLLEIILEKEIGMSSWQALDNACSKVLPYL